MRFICFDFSIQKVELSEVWFRQRAFLYGDAHFTTAKIDKGETQFWSYHLKRMQNAQLRLKFAPIDWEKLTSVVEELIAPISSGVLKIQIGRGNAERGYGKTGLCQPSVFVWLNDVSTPTPESPIALDLVTTPLSHNALLAGIKHCNRLEQVLIAHELEQQGLSDGLVSDVAGNLIETNKANVFWFANGHWYTSDLTHCGIEGVLRSHLLNQLPVDVTTRQTTEVVENCESMFICNSIIGIQGVESVVGRQLNLAPVMELKQRLKL